MHEEAVLFLELGVIVVVLALLARLALHLGLSPIPLYLLAGLATGEGGLVPVITSETFIEVGADLGIVLLLLLLGLQYSAGELVTSLRTNRSTGVVDLLFNFTPGYLAGLLLEFGAIPALFLGAVTYISSSGVAAKLIEDLRWVGNRETPLLLGILVFEDLAMAVILPVLGALALGGTIWSGIASAGAALALVAAILLVAYRQGERLSRWAFSSSDEVNLLTVLGVTLVVAGVTERMNVSAAVGAFLVGIGVSGEAANRAAELLAPLRDLFAAVFFIFFGLRVDPATLPPLLLPIAGLALVTGLSKYATAYWIGLANQLSRRSRRRAGAALVARGEFSIVIGGLALAAGAPPQLTALVAGYVLVMATAGPLLARAAR